MNEVRAHDLHRVSARCLLASAAVLAILFSARVLATDDVPPPIDTRLTSPLSFDQLSKEEQARRHQEQKTAADLKSCPDGHATLKDVPIGYGAFRIHTEPEAEWSADTRAFARSVAKGEFILGGCVVFASNPKFRVVCQTCGYHYYVWSVPDHGCWRKEGSKMADFTTAFSEPSRTLPFATHKNVKIRVDLAQGKVEKECFDLKLQGTEAKQMLQRVRVWIKTRGYDPGLLFEQPLPAHCSKPGQIVEGGKARIELSADAYLDYIDFSYQLERPAEDDLEWRHWPASGLAMP